MQIERYEAEIDIYAYDGEQAGKISECLMEIQSIAKPDEFLAMAEFLKKHKTFVLSLKEEIEKNPNKYTWILKTLGFKI